MSASSDPLSGGAKFLKGLRGIWMCMGGCPDAPCCIPANRLPSGPPDIGTGSLASGEKLLVSSDCHVAGGGGCWTFGGVGMPGGESVLSPC